MGITSIVAALAYMGGTRPIAYTPLGELTVFLFFGLIATVGSYFLQTGDVNVKRVAYRLRTWTHRRRGAGRQ
jgi:1,4-dihydroxy-2-naphthoate polyprenyltransferase